MAELMGIVDFATARLDEDAAAAREAAAFYDDADENGVIWRAHEGMNQNGFMNVWLVPHLGVIYDPASGRHIVRHHPARVLAEVAAKRELLRRYEDAVADLGEARDAAARETPLTTQITITQKRYAAAMRYVDALWVAVALAVAPYAGHPGYREEWAP